MGCSLIGPGGDLNYDGIYMNARTNVEIRNGTVKDFPRRGIYEESTDGTGHRIINIRVMDNHSHGIQLSGYSHLIEKCTAVDNSYYGIWTDKGSTVIGNTCYKNTSDGIYTNEGCTVSCNTCYGNFGNGIHTGNGATVTGNTSYGNTLYGISLGTYSLVDQNTTYSNGTNMNSPAGCVFGQNVKPS
jgi:hypothetical protein